MGPRNCRSMTRESVGYTYKHRSRVHVKIPQSMPMYQNANECVEMTALRNNGGVHLDRAGLMKLHVLRVMRKVVYKRTYVRYNTFISERRQIMAKNEQQDHPSEQIPSRQSERARTVVVPRVQSMRDYILKHHKRMILSALNDWVKIQVSPKFLLNNKVVLQLNVHNCIFSDMTFWRCDTYTLLVDVIVKTNLSWNGEFGDTQLYCELWVDMRQGMSFICGECGYLTDKPERSYWMLSEYLVPILRKDEIEDGAERLLQQHLPGVYQNPREHYAEALAQKMGLTVVRYPLHQRSRTRSILFFRSGKITVAQTDSDGQTVELPYAVQIPANTIVINTNAVHKDHCQLDIFHECIHYDWHFMFFRLQDMYAGSKGFLEAWHHACAVS